MDLRTQKIYDALIQAFRELLEEKPFEQITVNELCERARTRRATFYKHFKDKYDFMDFMLRQLRLELMQDASGKLQSETPQEYYRALIDLGLDFVQQNCKMLLNMINSSMLYVMLQTVTEKMNDDFADNQMFRKDEIETQFMIGALNQCAKWWLLHMDKVSKEEMQQKLYELFLEKY